MTEPMCDRCNDTGTTLAGDPCTECCEHEIDADEGFTCLNCGISKAEDVMSAAYDRAKSLRQYGH